MGEDAETHSEILSRAWRTLEEKDCRSQRGQEYLENTVGPQNQLHRAHKGLTETELTIREPAWD